MQSLTSQEAQNVQVKNFMGVADPIPTFDVIFTNPPWGQKLPKRTRTALAKQFGAGKSDDTSALFLFAAMQVLSDGGTLGMLLPDAFFNIGRFSDARVKVLAYRILSMTDFGRPFAGVMTKVTSIILQKADPKRSDTVACTNDKGTHLRDQQSFLLNPKFQLNFALSTADHDVIRHLFRQPHCTLKNRAAWALGIITGDNKRYIREAPTPGHLAVSTNKSRRSPTTRRKKS